MQTHLATRTIKQLEEPTPPKYGWRRTLVVNFAPGIFTVAATLSIAPMLKMLGWPPIVGYTIAIALVTVFEVAYLRRYARRTTGSSKLSGALSLRRRMPKKRVAIYSLGFVAMTAALAAVLAPLMNAVADATTWLPDNLSPGLESGDVATYGHLAIILALLANWTIDAVVNPIVEELYWKGHLMTRLPVSGILQPILLGLLFATEHFWQPADFLLVVVAQVAISIHAWKSRSVDVAITTHLLVNTIVTATTAVAVLA